MTVTQLVITLICLGVALWAFNTYWTAIDATAKKLINGVIIFIMVLVVLNAFGILDALNMPVPRFGGR